MNYIITLLSSSHKKNAGMPWSNQAQPFTMQNYVIKIIVVQSQDGVLLNTLSIIIGVWTKKANLDNPSY